MIDKNKQSRILEALEMQPLSDEEKTKRHILGRLYGPIATTTESTRNGRKYNKELWEKALNSDLLAEKINTKGLFLELGHPNNREETDMTCVCACIPELPKIIDGDLYAYVDILDTPNGKLLKTLCDYGFQPGISSRGSGEVGYNNEVDPESFFLETWDIVQIPAVKKARLNMCESLNNSKSKLKIALKESLEKEEEKDKKIMEDALNRIEIDVDNSEDIEKIDADELENTEPVETEEANKSEEEFEYIPLEELEAVTDILKDKIDVAPTDDGVVIAKEGELEDEDTPKLNIETTKEESDLINKALADDEPEAKEEENSKSGEEVVSELEAEVKEEPTAEENTDADDIEEISLDELENSNENPEEKEEADDDGTTKLLENIKELSKTINNLREQLQTLIKEKTVSDAKVLHLKEDCNKYKDAYVKVLNLANKSTMFEDKNNKLQEDVNNLNDLIANKNTEIMRLKASNRKINEELISEKQTSDSTKKVLQEQLNNALSQVKTLSTQNATLKNNYEQVTNKYVANKAELLGVSTNTITSKLTENYSLSDVDRVCDNLLNNNLYNSKATFPFQNTQNRKVIMESKEVDQDYEDLLRFAGLK